MSLRQTELSGLRGLRRKLSVEVRGGSGRWSAAAASVTGPSELVILDVGSSRVVGVQMRSPKMRTCNVSRQR